MKYEKERCELIECARAMEHYGLVMLSGGNVSLRMKDGTFLVTPSAMAYDSMIPEDIVLVNGKGETIEGKRRPTSDLEAILYIFEKMLPGNIHCIQRTLHNNFLCLLSFLFLQGSSSDCTDDWRFL